MSYKPGQAVVWSHEPRGGYGYMLAIDATVVRVGAKRIQIEVTTVSGTKRIWVTPERLRPARQLPEGDYPDPTVGPADTPGENVPC